jgi:hypothetical protein
MLQKTATFAKGLSLWQLFCCVSSQYNVLVLLIQCQYELKLVSNLGFLIQTWSYLKCDEKEALKIIKKLVKMLILFQLDTVSV